MAQQQPIIVMSDSGRGGSGFIGSILLIAGVGLGGYYLYDCYTKCAWPFDGSISGLSCGGKPECASGEVKCVSGYLNTCGADGKFQATTTPCGVQTYDCSYCATYDCVKSFLTQAALDAHLVDCHGGALTLDKSSPDWVSALHTKGAKRVVYEFCRKYLIQSLTGTIYVNLKDVPAWCTDLDVTVEARVNGIWQQLAPSPVIDAGGSDWTVPAAMAMAPSVVLDALRFSGHASGTFCGSWDPRIEQMSFSALVSLEDTTAPKVCTGGTVGWWVEVW